MTVRTSIVGLVVAGLVAGAFAAGVWLGATREAAPRPLPVLGAAPQYTLTNQLGHRVSSQSFGGKVQLVTFLFPYCTGYCPLITHELVGLEQLLQGAGLADRVQMVAFNVGPEDAGPAEMAVFLQQYGWSPRDTRLQFLTGAPDEVRRVVTGGFGIDYRKVTEAQQDADAAAARQEGHFVPEPEVVNPLAERVGADYDVIHNDALVVVDPEGRVRALYDEADRLPDEQLLVIVTGLLGGG